MFITTANLAKAKSKMVLVQMLSAAGTGYCFNAKRNRLSEKMVMRKNDPIARPVFREEEDTINLEEEWSGRKHSNSNAHPPCKTLATTEVTHT
ncbi:unnamed protein product [Lampetra planeri]